MNIGKNHQDRALDASHQSAGDILAVPRYTTAEISKATDVPAETIRTWFKRGVLTLKDEKGLGTAPEAKGLGRKFNAYMAMVIAIMGRLTEGKGGISAELAKQAAFLFSFTGDESRPICGLRREREGQTWLIIRRMKDGIDRCEVESSAVLDMASIFAPEGNRVVILRLDALWKQVFGRLEIIAEYEAIYV